jgi:hypothetical protein
VFFECFCEHKVALVKSDAKDIMRVNNGARVGAKSDRDPPRTCAEKILAASIQSTKISLSGKLWCKHLICKELGVLEPFDNLSTGLDWIGVGRALAPPPSEPDRRYSRIRLSS